MMHSAIFYDLENMGLTEVDLVQTAAALKRIVGDILTSPLVGRVQMNRAYISRECGRAGPLRKLVDMLGIELCEVDPIDGMREQAALVGFRLFGDAITLLDNHPELDTVVLAVGDGDCAALCEYIKRTGRKLVMVSYGVTTSKGLLAIADDWIDLSGGYNEPCRLHELWLMKIPKSALDADQPYLPMVREMLSRAARMPILLRYIARRKGTASVLNQILSTYRPLPGFKQLGFRAFTDFAAFLLEQTPFFLRSTGSEPVLALREQGQTQPRDMIAEECAMFARITRRPEGYSPERARMWRGVMARYVTDIEELLAYISFFLHNQIVRRTGGRSSVANEEDYSMRVGESLGDVLGDAQFAPNPEAVEQFLQAL